MKDECVMLKVKYKSFLKCRRNTFITTGLVLLSISFKHISPVFTIILVFSAIVLWSSIFGMLSNYITKEEKLIINRE